LFHTLLPPQAGGDTLAWVVNAYGILGIHRLQASQKTSLHPKATNIYHNASCDTVSNAFLKSTKQQQNGFFFALLCFIKVRNMKS
jgi:hypothetical protein